MDSNLPVQLTEESIELLMEIDKVLTLDVSRNRKAYFELETQNKFCVMLVRVARSAEGTPTVSAALMRKSLAGQVESATDVDGIASVRMAMKKLGETLRVKPLNRKMSPEHRLTMQDKWPLLGSKAQDSNLNNMLKLYSGE